MISLSFPISKIILAGVSQIGHLMSCSLIIFSFPYAAIRRLIDPLSVSATKSRLVGLRLRLLRPTGNSFVNGEFPVCITRQEVLIV